ncbi:MAG: 4-hydroxy-tetrahydrodipicolinate reductase, partial [Alicyclobacillus sp.]|nr:4-hydroxy-tetrahydrodipicolinate reductase [Alicyclobacillus sp.]
DVRSVVNHVDHAVTRGVRPVIGATGYTPDDLARWDRELRAQGLGGIAAPNFALGALLMIRFAREAARWYGRAEIIELHHDGKKDAPSGTAKRTAQAMMEERGDNAAIPIHSVRLPGLVAHQEVIFGGTGEVLTIRHDSLSRTSFMPGVLTACEQVMTLTGLVHGLEHVLW